MISQALRYITNKINFANSSLLESILSSLVLSLVLAEVTKNFVSIPLFSFIVKFNLLRFTQQF